MRTGRCGRASANVLRYAAAKPPSEPMVALSQSNNFFALERQGFANLTTRHWDNRIAAPSLGPCAHRPARRASRTAWPATEPQPAPGHLAKDRSQWSYATPELRAGPRQTRQQLTLPRTSTQCHASAISAVGRDRRLPWRHPASLPCSVAMDRDAPEPLGRCSDPIAARLAGLSESNGPVKSCSAHSRVRAGCKGIGGGDVQSHRHQQP